MTTTKETLTKLMTTTAEEDTQYLNEVIQEIKNKTRTWQTEIIHRRRITHKKKSK